MRWQREEGCSSGEGGSVKNVAAPARWQLGQGGSAKKAAARGMWQHEERGSAEEGASVEKVELSPSSRWYLPPRCHLASSGNWRGCQMGKGNWRARRRWQREEGASSGKAAVRRKVATPGT